MDAGVPITAGTWDAVQAGADVALTGAQAIVDGAQSAFALCRPPGHHAVSGQQAIEGIEACQELFRQTSPKAGGCSRRWPMRPCAAAAETEDVGCYRFTDAR